MTDAIDIPGLVPKPTSITAGDGWFELDRRTVLDAGPGTGNAADWLRAELAPATGLPLAGGESSSNAITFRLTDPSTGPGNGPDTSATPESYRLSVSADGVLIEAGGPAGAFYAAQTLRSLLPAAAYRRAATGSAPWRVPAVVIADRPRFGWRGAMLDVARHFLTKQDVLRFIDLIALHKINILHLHLTDDQGWRIEIRRYPRLTEVGSWRRESQVGDRRNARTDGRPHGGYYTQDDIREIVAYAADRHITVVPEIDVPGHAGAALAAYPELGNTDVPGRAAAPDTPAGAVTRWGILDEVLNVEPATLEFLHNVFDEVMDLFPGRWIGVGGDECPTVEWAASPRARARMAELGIDDPDAIRSWYVARLAEHLAGRGRTLFGWDEICDGVLPEDVVVASWRGTGGAITAARQGHDVVLCPQGDVYLDYRQSDSLDEPIPVGTVTTLADVHAFNPVPAELSEDEAAHVLGAQCNIWTEHMDSVRVVDYLAFPRLCAFAETVWSGPGEEHEGFLRRMESHTPRLAALGVEYRHTSGPLPWQTRPDAPGWPRSE